ncbi:MAG: metalloregulator ArsR/SmtB family transcription factor [Treponema sp.]|nr:metalloregulator ArsR/SmtB family transcription factor [Treponema sp.]
MAKTDIDNCDCTVIHEDVVNRVRRKMPEEETLFELADLFKVFGDSTRVKIISALLHSEMCVCDIAALLGMSKSAISHQLKELRQTKLVKYRRDGKVVFYSLDDDHVTAIFKQGLSHVCEGDDRGSGRSSAGRRKA